MREVSGEAVKRYTWWAASTNSFWLVTGKDNAAAAHAEAVRTGKSVKEAALDVGLETYFNGSTLTMRAVDVLHSEWKTGQQPVHTNDA